MLGSWKCEHSVEHRTYFEYIRNIVIIIEANQLPNLLFKWIIFTLPYMCQRVKLFVPTAIYFTFSDVSEDFSQWLDFPFLHTIFSNASEANLKTFNITLFSHSGWKTSLQSKIIIIFKVKVIMVIVSFKAK